MAARESLIFTQPEGWKPAQHTGLYILLLLILAWAPIPIGSNRGWSLAILEAGTLLTVGVWALSYTWRPFEIPPAVYGVRHSLFILTLWIAYPLVQLIPLSPSTVEILGGGIGTLYGDLPSSIATDSAYLTLDRSATFAGFIRQCSLVALFFSVLATTTSVSRLRGLLILVLVVGFVEAFYGYGWRRRPSARANERSAGVPPRGRRGGRCSPDRPA